jgi:hypothetical protein
VSTTQELIQGSNTCLEPVVAPQLPTLFKANAEMGVTINRNEKRLRVIEHGLLSYPGEATFWVQAENFPLWLLP